MFRPFLALALFVFPHVPSAVAAATTDEIRYLSGTGSDDTVDWEFFCSAGRRAGEWSTIAVPSNWEQQGFGTYNYGHDQPKADERGKYRHRFEVPESWRGRRIDLVFEGVMTDTEVWVNGKPAGPVHQGGFQRFEYDISGRVEFGADNLLEVTVSKVSANESVERAERKADYWVFGGIYRPVFLRARPVEHIEWAALDARADGSLRARVHTTSGARDADNLWLELHDGEGRALGEPLTVALAEGGGPTTLETRFEGIRPWSPESPQLYHLRLRLRRNAETLHETTERFGFRTFEMRPGDGFYLNGAKLRFKGVNRHCFWPTTGRAVHRSISYDDARLIREMNMNAVRMSHYPPDKHFLEACDELGLLVINELTGWHDAYDTPSGRRLLEAMIRRDANHPCVVLWANGNEGGHNHELVPDYARLDPQSRPVIHPTPSWVKPSVFHGVDTAHYPDYEDHLRRLRGSQIYLPTEFLHALYDGGAGAGLRDYWQAIRESPVGAGGFLWALTDESVARTDRGGRLDSDGNHAPDGILGPFREKSGSFDAIREIWSPVQLADFRADESFSGRIGVANEFLFTSLDASRFDWALLDFPAPGHESAGARPARGGSQAGPALPPGESGWLQLDLPDDWRRHDLLKITARGPDGAEIHTWSRAIHGPSALREREFTAGQGKVIAAQNDGRITLRAGGVGASFDAETGVLLEITKDGARIPFENGPRFVPAAAFLHQHAVHGVRAGAEQEENKAANAIDGKPATRWSARGEGAWLELDLGGSRRFGEVAIHWQDGHSRSFRFRLESSADRRQWQPLFEGESDGKTAGAERYRFAVTEARYLRLSGQGNTRNEWTSIHHISIPDPDAPATAVSHRPVEGGHAVEVRAGRGREFRWTMFPSGGLRLDWAMKAEGEIPHAGITFGFPEDAVLSKEWIGTGPHRVWSNRMAGARLDAHAGPSNNARPGLEPAEPEFQGCFGQLHRLRLLSRHGTLTFHTDTPDLFFRVFSPNFGDSPMNATAAMPEGDLSFLHAIPAIGTKFRASTRLGPQSRPHRIGETLRGNLYLQLQGTE
jgi:hypothetical protein